MSEKSPIWIPEIPYPPEKARPTDIAQIGIKYMRLKHLAISVALFQLEESTKLVVPTTNLISQQLSKEEREEQIEALNSVCISYGMPAAHLINTYCLATGYGPMSAIGKFQESADRQEQTEKEALQQAAKEKGVEIDWDLFESRSQAEQIVRESTLVNELRKSTTLQFIQFVTSLEAQRFKAENVNFDRDNSSNLFDFMLPTLNLIALIRGRDRFFNLYTSAYHRFKPKQ